MGLLEKSDHLVVELLGDSVGLVVVQEGREVQFARDLLRLLPRQPRPGVLRHDPAGLLETLPAGRVDLRLVLLVLEDGHDWRDPVVRRSISPAEEILLGMYHVLHACPTNNYLVHNFLRESDLL